MSVPLCQRDDLVRKELTGEEFNKLNDRIILKFTNERENHHGYQFQPLLERPAFHR